MLTAVRCVRVLTCAESSDKTTAPEPGERRAHAALRRHFSALCALPEPRSRSPSSCSCVHSLSNSQNERFIVITLHVRIYICNHRSFIFHPVFFFFFSVEFYTKVGMRHATCSLLAPVLRKVRAVLGCVILVALAAHEFLLPVLVRSQHGLPVRPRRHHLAQCRLGCGRGAAYYTPRGAALRRRTRRSPRSPCTRQRARGSAACCPTTPSCRAARRRRGS